MSNITITQVSEVQSIEALRQDVADAVVRAYGAERKYAEALCNTLPAEWYLVEHNDKGETAKPVHAEKKALFKVLNGAKHSNPSTVWARVRKYAQEYIEGVPEVKEGETAPASVGARHTRSLNLRLIEELSTLFKACKNADSLSDKERDCQTHITSALIAMGVDPTTIE
jgi:Holliday junction resolvasome RuvABC DNA-binding subunit